MSESHQHHASGHSLWPLVAIGAVGAVIALPYVLPAIGIGTSETATEVLNQYHSHQASGGSGLAGFIARGISHVPLIGESLAAGGWGTIAATGLIGIGGVLLANWLEKRESADAFPWSKIIRYSALATSMLISLPSLLTGIGGTLMFLSSFFITQATTYNALLAGLGSTIGSASMASMSGSGGVIATMLPHLFSCGASLIPLSLAHFMNGTAKETPVPTPTYHCQLAAPCQPVSGQPCEVAFRLTDHHGTPLTESALEILHTRPLHTMIVDSSLRDYHHLHPVYDPARHCFVAQFTPNLQTGYTLWNDFTIKGESTPTHTRTALTPARSLNLPARIAHTSHVEGAGLSVTIRPDTPLRAGGHHTLTLDIRDAAGRPVTDLEPIMGAYAHLAAFSADGQHFIHTHPLGPEPTTDAARGTSPLSFHVMPEVEGPTQFFLQIQRAGRILTLPFGQMIAPAQEHECRLNQQQIARATLIHTVAHSH